MKNKTKNHYLQYKLIITYILNLFKRNIYAYIQRSSLFHFLSTIKLYCFKYINIQSACDCANQKEELELKNKNKIVEIAIKFIDLETE